MYTGAKNHTQALWQNSLCFQLLSHLFSPIMALSFSSLAGEPTLLISQIGSQSFSVCIQEEQFFPHSWWCGDVPIVPPFWFPPTYPHSPSVSANQLASIDGLAYTPISREVYQGSLSGLSLTIVCICPLLHPSKPLLRKLGVKCGGETLQQHTRDLVPKLLSVLFLAIWPEQKK